MKNRPRLIAGLAALSLVAGCESSPTTPTPTPAPTAFTLSGTVRIAPPTSQPFPGVTVTIVDGQFAGLTAVTREPGTFSFTNLQGTMTVRASRPGHESQTLQASAQNPTLAFSLRPTPETFTQRRGWYDGERGPCLEHGAEAFECRTYTLDLHNSGTVAVTLTAPQGVDGLALSLWRGQTRLAGSTRNGATVTLNAAVEGGFRYHLHLARLTSAAMQAQYVMDILRPN